MLSYVFMWSLFCADLQVLVEILCLEISILYKKKNFRYDTFTIGRSPFLVQRTRNKK